MSEIETKPDPIWSESCGATAPEDLLPPLPPGASEEARRCALFDFYSLGLQSPRWLLNQWVPLPVHIYDGDLTMIVGHAPLRPGPKGQVAVKRSSAPDDNGCIVLLWIGHYTDTSLGPYDSVWASIVTAPSVDGEPEWLRNPLWQPPHNGDHSTEPYDFCGQNVLDNPFLLALPVLQPETYRFTSIFWRVSARLPQRVLTDIFGIKQVERGAIDVGIHPSGNARFLQFLCTDHITGDLLAQGRVRHEDDDREVAFQFAPVSNLLGWQHTRDLIVQNVQQRPYRGVLTDADGNEQAVLKANFLPFLRLWEWHPTSGDQIRLAAPSLDHLGFVPVLYFRTRGFKGVLKQPDAAVSELMRERTSPTRTESFRTPRAKPDSWAGDTDPSSALRKALLSPDAFQALSSDAAAENGEELAGGDDGAPDSETPTKKKGPKR